MNFLEQTDGLKIAYHWEGCETFIESGSINLSMATLSNDRPLYISNNVLDWFPNHLPRERIYSFKLYEISFILPKEKKFTIHSDYMHINPFYNNITKELIVNDEFTYLLDNGYKIFSIDKNDKNEIHEAFIINPITYVKRIIPIDII